MLTPDEFNTIVKDINILNDHERSYCRGLVDKNSVVRILKKYIDYEVYNDK